MNISRFPLNAKRGTPLSAVFSPDDRYLAVLYRDAPPTVYSLVTQAADKLVGKEPACWADFCLTPTQEKPNSWNVELAFVLPADGKVKRYNLDKRQARPTLQVPDVCRCAYTFNGSLMATGTTCGEVTVWRLQDDSDKVVTPEKVAEFEFARSPVAAMAFNSTNLLLYVVLASGEVRMVDLHTQTDFEVMTRAEAREGMHPVSVHTHPQKPSTALLCGLADSTGHSVSLWSSMSREHTPVPNPLGAYVRSARIVNNQTVAAVGQRGFSRLNLDHRNSGPSFATSEGQLVMGGSISRQGKSALAYWTVEKEDVEPEEADVED